MSAVVSEPAGCLERVDTSGFIIRRMSVTAVDSVSGERGGALLSRLAAGEDVASLVLDRFGGLVWSLARRLCETDADAEDAVQDIFLDIWKSAERYDGAVASETTFVAMIARRRLIDRRRRISRRPGQEAMVEDAVADAGGAADRGVATSDEARAAERAMSELSVEQQRVLRLSVFHGLSHDSIAKATGLPLGTVKTHARRGLIKVRKVLAESGFSVGEGGLGGAS